MPSLRIVLECSEPLCRFVWPRQACIERHGGRDAAAEHIRGNNPQCPACGNGHREIKSEVIPSPWEIIIETPKEAAHV